MGWRNIARTLPILSLLIFLITSIFYFYTREFPATIASWSQTINVIVASGLIISILGVFFVFNRQIINGLVGEPMPRGDRPNEQFNWLYQSISKYLFISIAVGLALALLVLFIKFGFENTLFSVTGTTFIMITAGLIGLSMIYYMMKSNPAIMNIINSSIFL